MNTWTDDVIEILDKIRINSIVLSNEHKKKYFKLSRRIKWFRIPVIVFSALGSLFGFGLSPYVSQIIISEITSVLSLFVGLIGSLELFLGVNHKMEKELLQSKELYLFSIEIQKTLLLDAEHRPFNGVLYLEDKFNVYSKYIQDSHLLECKVIDELTPLPSYYQDKIKNSSDECPKRSSFMKQLRSNQIEPIIDIGNLPVIYPSAKKHVPKKCDVRHKSFSIPRSNAHSLHSRDNMQQSYDNIHTLDTNRQSGDHLQFHIPHSNRNFNSGVDSSVSMSEFKDNFDENNMIDTQMNNRHHLFKNTIIPAADLASARNFINMVHNFENTQRDIENNLSCIFTGEEVESENLNKNHK